MIENIEYKKWIEDLVDDFGCKNQDGIKEALRYTQDLYGYVSKVNQKYIAEVFDVENNMIATIIRFMPSIKEKDIEYEIVCCSGARCAKNGSFEVLQTVKNVLGIDFNEYTDDGKIKLSTQNCFKKCNLGPNIKVNDKFYHKMDKSKAEKLMLNLLNK